MQIKHLLGKRNKVWGIDEAEYSPEAYEKEKKIKLYKQLRKEGCSEKIALSAIETSRATLFRWSRKYKTAKLAGLEYQSRAPDRVRTKQWDRNIETHILAIRKANILYGKYKIHAILKRDYSIHTSVSTVGRIISSLIQRKKIKPAAFYCQRKTIKSRIFNKHAERLKTCPITKMVVKQAYASATSNIAAQFFSFVRQELPFPVLSVQVDGGSEFMADFEQACKDSHIPLFVIPPRSPEYNGVVERANGSSKYEFYISYQGPLNLVAIRSKLKQFTHKYNHFRPHQALQYLTPWRYYQSMRGQSHML